MSYVSTKITKTVESTHDTGGSTKPDEKDCTKETQDGSTSGSVLSLGALFLWLIVLYIGTLVILYAVKPVFVLNTYDQVDTHKLVLSAFIASLFGVIGIWIIALYTS